MIKTVCASGPLLRWAQISMVSSSIVHLSFIAIHPELLFHPSKTDKHMNIMLEETRHLFGNVTIYTFLMLLLPMNQQCLP